MRFLATIAAILTGSASIAQDVNCATPSTQYELNVCAARELQAADAELNRLWRIVKPAADARGQGQALLDAQRAWLSYRDATCDAERAQYGAGSIAPMVHANCLERLTLRRNEELRAFR